MAAPELKKINPVSCRNKKSVKRDYYQECELEVPQTMFITNYFLVETILNERNKQLHKVQYDGEFPGLKSDGYLLVEHIYSSTTQKLMSINLCLWNKASDYNFAPKIVDHYFCPGFTYNTMVVTYKFYEKKTLDEYTDEYKTEMLDKYKDAKINDLSSFKKSIKYSFRRLFDIWVLLVKSYEAILFFTFFLKKTVVYPSYFKMDVKKKSDYIDCIYFDIIDNLYISPIDANTELSKIISLQIYFLNFFKDYKIDFARSYEKNNIAFLFQKEIKACIEDELNRLKKDSLIGFQYLDHIKNSSGDLDDKKFVENEISYMKKNIIDRLHASISFLQKDDFDHLFGDWKMNWDELIKPSKEPSEEMIKRALLVNFENEYKFPYCESNFSFTGINKEELDKYKNDFYFYSKDGHYRTDGVPNLKSFHGTDPIDIFIVNLIEKENNLKRYNVVAEYKREDQTNFVLEERIHIGKSYEDVVKELIVIIQLSYYRMFPDIKNNYICVQKSLLSREKLSSVILLEKLEGIIPFSTFLKTMIEKKDARFDILSTDILLFLETLILQISFVFSVLNLEPTQKNILKHIFVRKLTMEELQPLFFFNDPSERNVRYSILFSSTIFKKREDNLPIYKKKVSPLKKLILEFVKYFQAEMDLCFAGIDFAKQPDKASVYFFMKGFVTYFLYNNDNYKPKDSAANPTTLILDYLNASASLLKNFMDKYFTNVDNNLKKKYEVKIPPQEEGESENIALTTFFDSIKNISNIIILKNKNDLENVYKHFLSQMKK